MTDPRAAIDAVWRIEAPRLIAALARMTRERAMLIAPAAALPPTATASA